MGKTKDTPKDETTVESLAKLLKDHAKRLTALEKGADAVEDEVHTRLREVEQAVGITPKTITLKQIRKSGKG